jgi:hypothetical protein
MKCFLALLIALSCLVPAFGQAKSKSAAKASDDGARVVALDEQMASIVDADKSNCDKMANDIKAFADKNGAEMRRLSQEGQKRTKDEQAEFLKKYGSRIQAATAKMNAGVPGCIQNPKVKAALASLSGGPAAAPKR